jgi:hypothetical protein
MKHVPIFAFYAAVAVLLLGAVVSRASSPPERNRLAFSVAMEGGHIDVRAELGASLLALRL